MDCERCTYLMDDPERALAESASWTNVDACCRESLELARLEVGLRRVMREPEPAPELDAAILRAAAARKSGALAGVAGLAAAPIESVPTAGGFIRRLRQWVTAPQVAMATITALAVVLGVFYFPSQRPKMEAAGDTVMGVPSAASPEPQVATASPSEMGPSNAPAILPPKPEGSASAQPTSAGAVAVNDRMQLAQADVPSDERARLMASAQLPADDARLELDGVAREEAQGYAAGRGGDTGQMLALAEPETESAPAYEAYAPPSPTRSTSRQTEAPSSYGGATPTPPATTSPTTAGAANTAPGVAAPDLLTQARSLRSRGQCAAAIPLYDRYLAEGGAARGDALIEEAQCLAQTGHTDRARQLYQRATAIPAVASRARSGLDSLGTTSSSATASRAAAATTTMTETRARAATGSAEHSATAVDSAADSAFDSH